MRLPLRQIRAIAISLKRGGKYTRPNSLMKIRPALRKAGYRASDYVTGYHGTTHENAASILREGFRSSPSGTWFGALKDTPHLYGPAHIKARIPKSKINYRANAQMGRVYRVGDGLEPRFIRGLRTATPKEQQLADYRGTKYRRVLRSHDTHDLPVRIAARIESGIGATQYHKRKIGVGILATGVGAGGYYAVKKVRRTKKK